MEEMIQMSSGDRKRGVDGERSDEEKTEPPKRRRMSGAHQPSSVPSQSHSARLSRIFERRRVILAGRTESQERVVEASRGEQGSSQRDMDSERRNMDVDESELSEMGAELEEMGTEESGFRQYKEGSQSEKEESKREREKRSEDKVRRRSSRERGKGRAEEQGDVNDKKDKKDAANVQGDGIDENEKQDEKDEKDAEPDKGDEKDEQGDKETEEQEFFYHPADDGRFYCTVPGGRCNGGPSGAGKTGPFRDRYQARRHARNVHGIGGAPDVICPIPGCRSRLYDREACRKHVERGHPGRWRESVQLKNVVPYAPYVRDPGAIERQSASDSKAPHAHRGRESHNAKRNETISQNKGPGLSRHQSHRAKRKGKAQDESDVHHESRSDESEQEESAVEKQEQEESDVHESDSDSGSDVESDSAIHCYRRSRAGPFCTVPHCKKGPFKDPSGARRHARNGHGLGGATDVRCPIARCTMRLQTREACEKHVRKHHVGMWRDSFVLEHLVPTDPYVRPGKDKGKDKGEGKGEGKEKDKDKKRDEIDTKGQPKTKDRENKAQGSMGLPITLPILKSTNLPSSTNPLLKSTSVPIPRALPIPRPLPSGSGVRLEVRAGLPPSSLMSARSKDTTAKETTSSSLHHSQSSRPSSTLFSHRPNNGSSRRPRPNFSPYAPSVAQKCPFPTCKQIFRNESTLRRHERGHDWDRCLPGGDLYVPEAGASASSSGALLGSSTTHLASSAGLLGSSSTAALPHASSSAPSKYAHRDEQEGWASEESDDSDEDSEEEDDDAYDSGPERRVSKHQHTGSQEKQHRSIEKQSTKHDMKFHCEIGSCEYRTFRKDRLERHVRTHTGEKPFECEECDYRVAQEQNLRRHYKVHHPDKSVPPMSRV